MASLFWAAGGGGLVIRPAWGGSCTQAWVSPPPPPPTHTHLLAFRCPALQFDDKLLSWSRLDFLKLADYDEVLRLVRAGVAYAQRRDAAGGFDSTLGELRKGALRRAVELPVRVVSNVVRQAVV